MKNRRKLPCYVVDHPCKFGHLRCNSVTWRKLPRAQNKLVGTSNLMHFYYHSLLKQDGWCYSKMVVHSSTGRIMKIMPNLCTTDILVKKENRYHEEVY